MILLLNNKNIITIYYMNSNNQTTKLGGVPDTPLPMFRNGAPNFWVFNSLISYFIIDIFIKMYKNCVIKMSDLFLNVLLGLASSALIVTLMYAGGSGKYLFFNEVSSNKEICYQPKEQTFKCSLYRNGELISGIN